jgi:uncharacterized OsmC-like protein
MGYCVAGITLCFIATFVSIASSQGIAFDKLHVNAECNINFAKTFDAADEPITEGINFEIDAEVKGSSDGNCDKTLLDKQNMQQLIKMAEERCPAIYSMNHIVKVNAKLK